MHIALSWLPTGFIGSMPSPKGNIAAACCT
jgi:hypothetical protein